MDQDTRHWYLQQMGIPVWVPKNATDAVMPETKAVATPAEAPVAQPEVPQATPEVSTPDSKPTAIWLVMPNVAASEQASAKELLDKILAAVAVPADSCELIWGLPDAMPSADVKWVWCFGVQPPPGLVAKTLSLPSLADMLTNVAAKKHAWGILKSAMPFA